MYQGVPADGSKSLIRHANELGSTRPRAGKEGEPSLHRFPSLTCTGIHVSKPERPKRSGVCERQPEMSATAMGNSGSCRSPSKRGKFVRSQW